MNAKCSQLERVVNASVLNLKRLESGKKKRNGKTQRKELKTMVKNLDIRILLMTKGITQKELAKELNVSPFKVCRMMKDGISGTDRQKVLEALNRIESGQNQDKERVSV